MRSSKVQMVWFLKNEKLKVLKYAREALNFLESLDLKANDFTQKRVHKYFENIRRLREKGILPTPKAEADDSHKQFVHGLERL